MDSPLSIIFPIPDGTVNPFQYSANMLRTEMYPIFSPGFATRIAGLLLFLILIMILSAIYLTLSIIEFKQKLKPLWIFRMVSRPAGKYIVLNIRFLYPICSIFVALWWVLLVTRNYMVYGDAQGTPFNTLFWTPLLWIPLYTHLSTTTLSILGGANLASSAGSKEKDSGLHFLTPRVANSAYILVLPIMILTCTGVGIYTGIEWRSYAVAWKTCIDFLEVAALNFDGTIDSEILKTVGFLSNTRRSLYFEFVVSQKISAAVYITSAVLLILVNTIGGIYLVKALRKINEGRGRQSRSPEPRTEKLLSTTSTTTCGLPLFFQENHRKISNASSINPLLNKLEWDIILFFFSVVPACLVFIGYSVWLSTHYTDVLEHPILLEFSLFGMVWFYSTLVALTTITMIIKVSLSIWGNKLPTTPHPTPSGSQIITTTRESIVTSNSNFSMPTRNSTPPSSPASSLTYQYTRSVSITTSFILTPGDKMGDDLISEKREMVEVVEEIRGGGVVEGNLNYGRRKSYGPFHSGLKLVGVGNTIEDSVV